MASPHPASRSPSNRSTPSRSTPNGNRRVNGFHTPLRESMNGSPSRQVLEDYGRLYQIEERAFKRSLEQQTSEQQKKHVAALDYGLQEHRIVRESAERELELVRIENERERRRRAEVETQRIEEARRRLQEQKEEEERRRLESERAQENERQRQAALRQQGEKEAQARVAAQRVREEEEATRKAQEEKDRQARESAEAKRREENAQKEAARPTPQPTAAVPNATPTQSQQNQPPASTTPSTNMAAGLVSTPQSREAVHRQYLDLHQRLKRMRQEIYSQFKKQGKHTLHLSDPRRLIRTSIGQLSKLETQEAREGNKAAKERIFGVLDAAARQPEPTVDITQYLVENKQPPGAQKQGPGALLWMLNWFAKDVVRQLQTEAGADTKTSNAIGTLAVHVFSRANYLFNGQSLIDLLWAKYHKVCPGLFGINGNQDTAAGRAKIGWSKEDNEYLKVEAFYGKLSGLSAGFAAITLRDFSKTQLTNPAPNWIFWQSMARILNTPAGEVQPYQFVLIKAMTENTVERIIQLYGIDGFALLRQAIIVHPHEKCLRDEKGNVLSVVTAVQAMAMVLQRDLKLTL